MLKFLSISFLLFASHFTSFSQIKISSAKTSYDSILFGTPVYYQYSWDDPLYEERDSFKLTSSFKAFEILWDSMIISEGSVVLVSAAEPEAMLILDATGWDLIDKGWMDTVNYPNLSPIIALPDENEVEWRGFGFARELDTLGQLPSTGNVKIKIGATNNADFIYGDFSMIRPDLCFEGFGGLRPSITFMNKGEIHDWLIYGDPANPVLDSTIIDTAFNQLPQPGQTISINFSKTNFIKRAKNPEVKIYPNPVADILNLKGAEFNGANYRILSLDGKIIETGLMDSNQLDVKKLQSGNYILFLQINSQLYGFRMLKL